MRFVAICLVLVTLLALSTAQLNRQCGTAPQGAQCVKYEDTPASLGQQCGTCYQGVENPDAPEDRQTRRNMNLYCADAHTKCLSNVCQHVSSVERGEACSPTATSYAPCVDAKYPIECLADSYVCGSSTVFDAGMSCAQDDDYSDYSVAPALGCSQATCSGGRCASATTGCSINQPGSPGLPPMPNEYCQLNPLPQTSQALQRIAAGSDCTAQYDMAPCQQDATCVYQGAGQYKCVAYGSATVNQSCTAGMYVCSGDLACVYDNTFINDPSLRVCIAPLQVGDACPTSTTCDPRYGSSYCVCDYTKGETQCVGLHSGVKKTKAFVALAQCAKAASCFFSPGTQVNPYYGSCIDTHCASEYQKFICTEGESDIKSLQADNTRFPTPCGNPGSRSAGDDDDGVKQARKWFAPLIAIVGSCCICILLGACIAACVCWRRKSAKSGYAEVVKP